MPWRLWEYSSGGDRIISDWQLQVKPRAKLMQRLHFLRNLGPDVPPELISGPINGYPHIRKMKVKGTFS
jgi:hypothetical protein